MVIPSKEDVVADFARRLNELLEGHAPERGRSEWLSRLFNRQFSQQAAYKWLNAETIPDQPHLSMLCAHFGWNINYLFSGIGPKYATMDPELTEFLNTLGEISDENRRSLMLQARNARDLGKMRPRLQTKPSPSHPPKRRS